MYMSTVARLNMRHREKTIMAYYDDMGPGKGNCTFGIGALVHRGPCSTVELARKVTEVEVESEFVARVSEAERAVARNVKATLTQAQFDALVSFTYNRGPTGAFHAYELLNAGNFEGAASWISGLFHVKVKKKGRWVVIVAPGLIQRRAEESAPFRGQK